MTPEDAFILLWVTDAKPQEVIVTKLLWLLLHYTYLLPRAFARFVLMHCFMKLCFSDVHHLGICMKDGVTKC